MQLSKLVMTAICLLATVATCQEKSPERAKDCWIMQETGSKASLRGICAVSGKVCWASGSAGTVLRTMDGGESWKNVGPEDSGKMDFRDVHAWDADNAIIMCAGDPDRLYRTADGGQTWKIVYEYPDSNAFFDGMVFDKAGERGFLIGDPLDGRLFVLFTEDSGKSWVQLQPEEMPKLPEGIAGFAASGTNLCLANDGQLIIGLGGKSPDSKENQAMVAIAQKGKSDWQLIRVPILTNESSGVFSVVEVDGADNRIVAVGGDYTGNGGPGENVAISEDAGLTWRLPMGDPPTGFRSVVVVAKSASDSKAFLLAIGPSGTDRSGDNGESWKTISTTGFHTASFVRGTDIGWAAGSDGRIGKWNSKNRD